ncbi:MAG TPA: RNA polymerase sigma factor [Methylosinus sp.]
MVGGVLGDATRDAHARHNLVRVRLRAGLSVGLQVKWDLSNLFRRYNADLTMALRRRGLSSDAAADIAQETFLRVLTVGSRMGADREPDGDNPRGYLLRVARNLSIDLGRREGRSPFIGAAIDLFEATPDQAPSQEARLSDRQKLAAVAAALDELPERTRRAFEMHRLGERTLAEIAEALGLSVSRTAALIKDAYHHIRSRVAETE